MKVAFVTPELKPLVQRTNVAEIADSLPRALSNAGADVRIFLPMSVDVPQEFRDSARLVARVLLPKDPTEFEILEGRHEGIPVYLFGEPKLFATRHPYGNDEGPYPDNWRRYASFARAVLESLPLLDFHPDVLHCLDWTTGLVPLLRDIEYKQREGHPAAYAGTWFAANNLAMQGVFEREVLPLIGLPHSVFKNSEGLELAGKVNFLKAGCEFATIVGTHSPRHAERIQQQDRGYGLEETFRRRSKELVGISNGIDYATWDPSKDPLLPQPFSKDDKDLTGKRKSKATLQQSLNLDLGARIPLAAMIGRFDADSGFDLAAEMLTPILERNVEVVLMGAGQPEITKRFKTMETTFGGRCRVIDGYNHNTAHALMGGADFLLLPSHYHPGHSLAAIGMRYGVVPIVYAQSGLEDYVVDARVDEKKGTGIFFEHYTGEGLLAGIDDARKIYRDAASWKELVMRTMSQDFSWENTANEYIKAYRRVTRRVRGARAKD